MRFLAVVILFAQDTAPPTVQSVSARQDPTRISVTFSEPVEEASAEVAANYLIEPAIKVESAVRSTLDLKLVTLTVSPLADGVTYTLTAKNVRDCSTPPLTIAAPAKKSFTFAKGLFSSAPREEGRARAIPKFKQPVLYNTPG